MTIQPVLSYQPAAYQQPNGQPPSRPPWRGLSWLVQAGPKGGKSTFGATVPGPRVVLDAESGSWWAPGRKIEWNPLRQTVPDPGRHLTAGYGQPSITAGWESAMVTVHDVQTAQVVYDVLNSGRHPFNGCTMDSLTEVQQRMVDSLAGQNAMQRADWGSLLRQVNRMIRQYRDLITHPVKPLWGICYICGTHMKDGRWRPMLQGGSQDYAPYYVDILGYIAAMQDGSRHMLIGPHPLYETGERVGGRLPYSMPLAGYGWPGWTAQTMITQVNNAGG
jgi:hypothetical protein